MTSSSLLNATISFLLLAATLAVETASADEYFISYRFDGDYIGAATVSPELSSPSCKALPLVHLEIRNGILRAYDSNNSQIVKGIVTGEGFFNSDYVLPDGRTTLFEGTVDKQGNIIGGIFDSGCAWLVKLSKKRRG